MGKEPEERRLGVMCSKRSCSNSASQFTGLLLLTSRCQIPQGTFRGLTESMPGWSVLFLQQYQSILGKGVPNTYVYIWLMYLYNFILIIIYSKKDTNMVFLQISILSSIFIPQTMDHCMVTALSNQQQ